MNCDGTEIEIRAAMPRELVEALDRYVARERPTMTRAEALRAAFRDWAIEHGLLESGDDGLRPDDLNASNDD